MPLVEMDHFSYTYPGSLKPVLRDVSLTIEKGDFIVLTGKSGSGKSTLGKALAGFLFQSEGASNSGSITIKGCDLRKTPLYEVSEKVAYVQQNSENQFCTLTVADEIAFGLENQCVEPKEIEKRIDKVLQIVQGLSLKDRDLYSLSGGEKQKVAIASMLALLPDVLILDEPTSNLDPIATQQIFETLHNMREMQDITVVIIEHKLAQLKDFNPLIYILQDGSLKKLPNIKAFTDLLGKVELRLPTLEFSQKNHQKPLIELKQVNLKLNGKKVLNNIDLRLNSGEFVALMGPNGSGKTSLLQTIIGFSKPHSGEIYGFDRDLSNEKVSNLVPMIGYLFQNPDNQLFTQSVWDEAILTVTNLRMLTQEKEVEAQNWLENLSLLVRKNDHPQKLSYGEKRRLNLISILLHHPSLLLMDEFLIGQDQANALAWMRILRTYTERGNTIVFVNHHLKLIGGFCDRLVFLESGSILIDAPIEQGIEQLREMGYSAFTEGVTEVPAYV